MSFREEVISVTGCCGIIGALSIFTFLCLFTAPSNAAVGIFQAELDPLRQRCKLENEFFMIGVSPTQGFCGQVDCDENCHCFMYR